MELLFLIGVAWACSRGIEALRKPASARWAKYQAARKGTTPANRAKARAARAAVAGYWAGEITRGLPHARHGFARGWAEHKTSRAEAERDHVKAVADHEGTIARVRAEMAAHRHRLEVARKRAARPPTMSEQLAADVAARSGQRQNGDHPVRSENCTDPNCSCHAADPPLADGKTPGNGSPVSNGHQPFAPNGHSPQPTGGTMAGDMNYDTAVETSDKLQAAADQAANDEALSIASTMADELGGMTPDDRSMLSLAADVVSAAGQVRDGARKLQETSAALKDHLVSNYGPIQEAVDSGPGAAPEKEFVSH